MVVYVNDLVLYVPDWFGAIDNKKSDVPTEIFNQGLEKPLAREQEKSL